MSHVDFSSLKKAITQLRHSISLFSSEYGKNEDLHDTLRAGAIQGFEFTYELCIKSIRRFLEFNAIDDTSQEFTFAELIRMANEYDLLKSDISTWREYRKMRGTTSHSYNEKSATEIFNHIPNFLVDAEYLLAQFTKRSNGEL